MVSNITGTIAFWAPKNTSVIDVALVSDGACIENCSCSFSNAVGCPPAALTQGVAASCGIQCTDGTTKLNVTASFDEFYVSSGEVTVVVNALDDASGCATVAAPLLAALGAPWPWNTVNTR